MSKAGRQQDIIKGLNYKLNRVERQLKNPTVETLGKLKHERRHLLVLLEIVNGMEGAEVNAAWRRTLVPDYIAWGRQVHSDEEIKDWLDKHGSRYGYEKVEEEDA